jgi:hypothetical protein
MRHLAARGRERHARFRGGLLYEPVTGIGAEPLADWRIGCPTNSSDKYLFLENYISCVCGPAKFTRKVCGLCRFFVPGARRKTGRNRTSSLSRGDAG